MVFLGAPRGGDDVRSGRFVKTRLRIAALVVAAGLLALGGCAAGGDSGESGGAAPEPRVERAVEVAEEVEAPASDAPSSVDAGEGSADSSAPLAGTGDAASAPAPAPALSKVRSCDVGQGEGAH